jgi:ankyrin repeat protein
MPILVAHNDTSQTQIRIDTRDMSQPQKKGKQSPAEAAKAAAREKMSKTLWYKCENGSLVTQKELTRLIKAGADIEFKGFDDFTCLLEAALRGHLRTVRLLLSAGANKEAKTKIGSTPLWVAAEMGHVAVVNMLLAAGAKKDAKASNGSTPLSIAAQNGHLVRCSLPVRMRMLRRTSESHHSPSLLKKVTSPSCVRC